MRDRMHRVFHVGFGAGEVQLRAVGTDAYAEACFERREILVVLSEKPDRVGEVG